MVAFGAAVIFMILTHISSPEMTFVMRPCSIVKSDFDSHLLTGDDLDSHGDNNFQGLMLTHISSPEMTLTAIETTISNV